MADGLVEKCTVVMTEPVMMEMDRTENYPPGKEPTKKLSLKHKLKAHYEKKKAKPNLNMDPLARVCSPDVIAKAAVPVYLFTVFSSFKIGIFDVMPLIYEGQDNIILLQRIFVTILVIQMMSNWCGIRYVDSGYARFIRLFGKPNLLQKCTQKNESAKEDKNVTPDPKQSSPKIENPPQDSDESSKQTTRIDTQILISQLLKEADQANAEWAIQQSQRTSIDDLLKSNNDYQNKNITLDTCSRLSHSSESKSIKETKPRKNARSKDSAKTSGDCCSKQATPPEKEDGRKVKSYPYWSWTPCFSCRWIRPPRCHHCPMCKTCVLKRDHHCYFAGACVGVRNYRFFCVFLIWAWIAGVYATVHGFPFIYISMWEQHMSYVDVIFPIAIVRFLLGYVPFQVALSVTTLTSLLYFDSLASIFVYAHFRLIGWGMTSFEKAFVNSRSLEIRDTRTWREKYRAVFGENFALSLIFPTSFLYDPEEDPINWPHVYVIKHNVPTPSNQKKT